MSSESLRKEYQGLMGHEPFTEADYICWLEKRLTVLEKRLKQPKEKQVYSRKFKG